MKKAIAIVAVIGAASLMGACSNLFGCGCEPSPCCEPVYQSPCCGVQQAAPAPSNNSCGGGSCGSACGG